MIDTMTHREKLCTGVPNSDGYRVIMTGIPEISLSTHDLISSLVLLTPTQQLWQHADRPEGLEGTSNRASSTLDILMGSSVECDRIMG